MIKKWIDKKVDWKNWKVTNKKGVLNNKRDYRMKKENNKKEDEEISFATSKKNMLKFKLVFIGDQAVGKSSIITRFIKDLFD